MSLKYDPLNELHYLFFGSHTDRNILEGSYLLVKNFPDFPLWKNRIASYLLHKYIIFIIQIYIFQAHCIVKICEDNASKHGADLLKPLNDLLNSCDNISVIQMALKGMAVSVVEFQALGYKIRYVF